MYTVCLDAACETPSKLSPQTNGMRSTTRCLISVFNATSLRLLNAFLNGTNRASNARHSQNIGIVTFELRDNQRIDIRVSKRRTKFEFL